MIRAIIFDFDGVIVDSVDVKTAAFGKLFEDQGPDVVQRVIAYHLENGGISRVEKFRYYYSHILRQPLPEKRLAELCDRFAGLVIDAVSNARLVPGALDALEMCRDRGYLAFVASGTPEDELCLILERRGLSSYFSGIYGSPPRKQEILRFILLRHQLLASEVLFVGDTMSDYTAAKETGIHFVGRSSSVARDMWAGVGVEMLEDMGRLEEVVPKLSNISPKR